MYINQGTGQGRGRDGTGTGQGRGRDRTGTGQGRFVPLQLGSLICDIQVVALHEHKVGHLKF